MKAERLKLGLKHMGSMLRDAMYTVVIDRQRRIVTLEMEGIDSWLLGAFVVGTLPDHGVIAFRDETVGCSQPAPHYRARIRFDGRFYGIEVAKLALGGIGVYVEPAALEWQRRAQYAATELLRALHEAGFDAIVSNIDESDQLTSHEPGGPLEVWIRPGTPGHADTKRAARIVEAASPELQVLVMSAFIRDDDVRQKFAEPHLAWNPLRQRTEVRRRQGAVSP